MGIVMNVKMAGGVKIAIKDVVETVVSNPSILKFV
jgi:hypothetical protein